MLEVIADHLVEGVHRLGEELHLVGAPLLLALAAAVLRQFPDDVQRRLALGEVVGAVLVGGGRRAAPRLLGLLQRSVLLREELAELPAELLLRRALDALARPEQERVFVLDLNDRQRRVLRKGDAGVGVLLGEHLLHPVLVGRLEFLVEEQQAPVAPAARIEDAHRRLDAGGAGPVGRVGDVNALFLHRRQALPEVVAVGLVDAHQVAAGGGDVAVKAHHVDPALGEEAGMAREVLVERPVVDRPEARGLAVGEGEVVAVFGPGDETVLAGELLVEAAQVEQRLGTELVARRLERPAALGGDFAGVGFLARLPLALGREGSAGKHETVEHPVIVIVAVHLELDAMGALGELDGAHLDPCDEPQVDLAVVGDVGILLGGLHVDELPLAAVELVGKLRRHRVGADPEDVLAPGACPKRVSRFAGLLVGPVADEVAAGKLVLLHLVVPPGVARHGLRLRRLAFDPDVVGGPGPRPGPNGQQSGEEEDSRKSASFS